MHGSIRTKALLESRSIARWKSQLPSWRKKSPRQPVRSLRRPRKQRPPERRPAPAAPQGAAVSSSLAEAAAKAARRLQSPRRLLQQLNHHHLHRFSRSSDYAMNTQHFDRAS